jgi:hypothetical protein
MLFNPGIDNFNPEIPGLGNDPGIANPIATADAGTRIMPIASHPDNFLKFSNLPSWYLVAEIHIQ